MRDFAREEFDRYRDVKDLVSGDSAADELKGLS